MAWVYILQSLRDKRFYVGCTINLEQRLKHHKDKLTPSTKRFGEIELVFSQQFSTLIEARRIECKLKRLKRRDYIQKIIDDGIIKMRA